MSAYRVAPVPLRLAGCSPSLKSNQTKEKKRGTSVGPLGPRACQLVPMPPSPPPPPRSGTGSEPLSGGSEMALTGATATSVMMGAQSGWRQYGE